MANIQTIATLVKEYMATEKVSLDRAIRDIARELTDPDELLDSRTRNILIKRYGSLERMSRSLSEFGLAQIYGVGTPSIIRVKNALAAQGLELRSLGQITGKTAVRKLYAPIGVVEFWESAGIKTVDELIEFSGNSYIRRVTPYGALLLQTAILQSKSGE